VNPNEEEFSRLRITIAELTDVRSENYVERPPN